MTTKITKTIIPSEAVEEVIHLEQTKRGLDERLKTLRAGLLEETKRMDVISLKTGKYTLTRATRTTIRVVDDAEVKEELEKMGHQVITKEVVDMDFMKPLVKANVDKLDGATKTETEYLTIRSNKGTNGRNKKD